LGLPNKTWWVLGNVSECVNHGDELVESSWSRDGVCRWISGQSVVWPRRFHRQYGDIRCRSCWETGPESWNFKTAILSTGQ